MDENLAWRNYAADWHLAHGMPDCPCDDDTPDAELCQPSRDHADQMVAELDGPADKWNHDVWVAAWGRNEPLVMSGQDLAGLPPAPAGMAWLATRLLTKGRKAVELALLRLGENQTSTLARERVVPNLDIIKTRARAILQDLSD